MLFFILEGNDYNFNMKRKGQAFIIVVIIFGLIVSVFAISISTAMRSQALEETEIYQREQALYLAQMGINQMIYNINDGTTYTDGQSINGTPPDIGTYKATYYTPDTSGYNGIAYIKSEGTVGLYTRVIYASLQGSGSTEVFKYCLYSANGGYDGITNPSTSLINLQYVGYGYNSLSGTLPSVDLNSYRNISDRVITNNSYTYSLSDSGKLLYFDYTGGSDTLSLYFFNFTSITLSIATNYPNVVIYAGSNSRTTITWNPASKTIGGSQVTLPILVHNPPSGSFTIDFTDNLAKKDTLLINGFIFSNSTTSFKYISSPPGQRNYINITGELMVKSIVSIAGNGTINYTNDYFTNPPPYFITGNFIRFLPSSFREEY